MKFRHTAVVFVALLASTGNLFAQPLVLSGSDLVGGAMGEEIREALADAGLTARCSFEGTLQAEEDLATGKADIAIVAVPDNSREAFPGEAARYPFAFQVASVGVHPDNPLQEISYGQLAAIFRENESLDDWAALTEAPAWQDRKIFRIVTRMSDTMTFELFNALVLKGERVQGQIRIMDDRDEIADHVIQNPTSLVILPWNDDVPQWRYLAVKKGDAVRGYTPSNDNIFFGDYGLRLPFVVVVTERVHTGQLEAFLEVMYGERMAEVLRESHFIPVPNTERESLLLSLE
jgi:ABC-type phosphate transport system substrate-binding protein